MALRTWGGRLRRLIVDDPEDRWKPDPIFVGLAVFVALWVGKERDNVLYGIGVGAFVWGVREILFHFYVRRRRSRESPE